MSGLLLIAGMTFAGGTALGQAPVSESYRESRPAMGTIFTVDIYMPEPGRAAQVLDMAFEEIERDEQLLSNYRPTSELSRLSREAASGPTITDPETFSFLQRASYWCRVSGGAFDITVGPLLRAWGFKARNGRVPSATALSRLRPAVGCDKIRLDAATHSVSFSTGAAMELDPGSIGKGFAVDHVVDLLKAQGVQSAFISAGGSTLYGLGAPPGSEGWPVQIPDPQHGNGPATSILLRDSSLSTGACTEKYFVRKGHRYCHIFDPRTQRPVEGVLQSTVVAPSATDSDALSTVAFVLSPQQTGAILLGRQGVRAVVYLTDSHRPSCANFGLPAVVCPESAATTKRGVGSR